jgi:hypothetical protein
MRWGLFATETPPPLFIKKRVKLFTGDDAGRWIFADVPIIPGRFNGEVIICACHRGNVARRIESNSGITNRIVHRETSID